MKVYILYSYPAVAGDDFENRQIIDVYYNPDHAKQDCTSYNRDAVECDEDRRYDYCDMEVLNNPKTRSEEEC